MRRILLSWLICLLGPTSGTERLGQAGTPDPDPRPDPTVRAVDPSTPKSPNIVVIFTDDQGYGDLSCQGHPTIRTPFLDRMAAEGMRFTQFYSAASVCTPSRAGLLTGRLPIRSGMCSDSRRVLFPDSSGGLPAVEITMAEALSEIGYQTYCIGKWHLGHLPAYLPTRNGFDEYFGIPYSNDMFNKRRGDPPVPLMRGLRIVEQPVDQTTLTPRYTDEAVAIIRRHADPNADPFFIYLPHTFPHIPLFASEEARGTSARGLYGDVIEEIDTSVGRILETLRQTGLAERTMVVFTSDNGPWLTQDQRGGTAGLLRGGKGSTWEGGMREPGLFWWPGTIPAGRIAHELGATLDLMPTALALSGADLPKDRIYDGVDLSPVLHGQTVGRAEGPRQEMPFYRGERLFAYRVGPWKLHLQTQAGYRQRQAEAHDPPQLYHLEHDPSEKYDLAEKHPEVVREILQTIERHRQSIIKGRTQL